MGGCPPVSRSSLPENGVGGRFSTDGDYRSGRVSKSGFRRPAQISDSFNRRFWRPVLHRIGKDGRGAPGCAGMREVRGLGGRIGISEGCVWKDGWKMKGR